MGFLYVLVQWTWGILQTGIGFLLYLFYHSHEHFRYHHSIVTLWDKRGSMSLGMFIFLDKRAPEHILVHEFGHTIQSIYFGPFYMLIFGIPSFLWCNVRAFHHYRVKNRISYFSFYTEKSANILGEKYIDIF